MTEQDFSYTQEPANPGSIVDAVAAAIVVGTDKQFNKVLDAVAPASITAPVYNSREDQTFTFETRDDLGTSRFSHTFGALANATEDLVRFDNERSIEYASKGKTTDITPSSAAASSRLWLSLVVGVDGYGEEGEPLPENWKDLVPEDDKLLAINDLLFSEVVEDEDLEDAPVVTRRRAWGSSSSTKTIKIRSICDGREVITAHVFKAKTAADVQAYDRIKSGIRLTKKAMQLKPQMKAKAELYDRMAPETALYSGPVPLHHKALAITAFFETDAESTAKK